MRLSDCHNFHDFRRLAKRRLPGPIFDYIDGAADDEVTYRRNTASFERCDLVPNVLRGVETVDLSVTVMGQKLAMPFYCSPTALQRLFHHQRRTRRRGRGGEVRHDVRRILARHGQPRGIAQGARDAAGLSVLFSQGSRPQSRHAATRQGRRCRGHDADRRQHHRRQPRARPAHRLFDSVQADARRDAPVRDQADVGHQLRHPRDASDCLSSTSTSTWAAGAMSIGAISPKCWIRP